MTSLDNLDTENCFFRALIKLSIIKSKKIEEKECLFSIYNAVDHTIRITIINTKLVSESYTSMLTLDEFEEMKRDQELLIEFDDFPEQIKTLVDQYGEGKIKMRLHLERKIFLGFYTMSDVRELIVLLVSFKYTKKDDVIKFMLLRNDKLVAQCTSYFIRTKALEARVAEQTKQCNSLVVALERTYEENQTLSRRSSQADQECGRLRVIIEDINNKNSILLRDIQLCQKSNSDLTLSVSELRSDIESLKIGIEYYVKKTDHLQSLLIVKEKTTVPAAKYEKLNNMFCSAIADLLKCQINLKQILSQHEFQKTENFTLKEELTNCIDMIKDLEKKLKGVQPTKSSPPTAYEEKNGLLNEMIKKLELQNAATPEKNKK